ncbi:MAG: hypothetical protein PVF58_04070 [Candidatus Methanofastidiosia archaeon]|jgi:uncharacterized Zn finger protein
MQDITEQDVRSVFDEKTFSRGYEYYTGHHVETALKTGDTLTGRVAGTQESPYKVEVTITNTITSHCTCPVGHMCKHGAALLLQWVHNKESIIDIDQLMVWLKERDKEKLITIIHSMIEDSPYLAQDIVSFQKVKENTIDIDEISRTLNTDPAYYSLPEIIESFEKAEKIALMLVEEQQFKKAAQIYLLLVEEGVDILYTYDTGEYFCDKFLEYMGTFVNISKKLNTVNNNVIHKIIEEIIHYAKNLENEYAKDICELWTSKYVNRSHVYYDGVINVLKILKGILTEKEWVEYILNFAEKNKGKKKFMKQFRIHFSDITL